MTYEVPIERGKVREFARATKSKNPAFQGPSALIPPTFLTTARMTWEPREDDQIGKLGLDLRRLLHAEEEYIFHGEPPRAGQTLTCETRLLDQWEKEGRRGGTMTFSRIVNEFRDTTGQLVAEQRTTLVVTARPPKEAS